MDPLLLPLKETNPQFYAKYLARSQVKRVGSRAEDEEEVKKGAEAGATAAGTTPATAEKLAA